MNTVWLLQPIIPDGSEWAQPFGKVNAFVTYADDEQIARHLAANHCKDEGPEVWLDPDQTSCVELTAVDGSVRYTTAGSLATASWRHISKGDDDHGEG